MTGFENCPSLKRYAAETLPPAPSPADVHLAEMRDLADRIVAMGNTIRTVETGRPTVDVIDMGRELAELVRHYDPKDA